MTTAFIALADVGAQCPDGSQPPCNRRFDLPLRGQRWIVMPFETAANLRNSAWLRDATANLLYLELATWRDIEVVDDERVADRLRLIPSSSRAPLGLDAALTMARRFGAGNLVMGDVFDIGGSIQFVAKVYDVASGRRLRTVRETSVSADSLIPFLGRLSRAILALDTAPATVRPVGTTSMRAYRYYLEGVRSMQRFAFDSAQRQLERSVAADTAFALAHYKLAMLTGWWGAREDGSVASALRLVRRATRFGAALPFRERTLIQSLEHVLAGQHARACPAYESLVAADSMDAEAWYGLGRCRMEDDVIEFDRDSVPLRFRSDRNAALTAFRRVLQIDPSNHLAFDHILHLLSQDPRTVCLGAAYSCHAAQTLIAFPRYVGDSLVLEPRRVTDTAAHTRESELVARTNSISRGLDIARRAAAEWLEANPSESRARAALAERLLRVGRPAAAESLLVAAPAARARLGLLARTELFIKTGQSRRAIALLDSLDEAYASHVRVIFGRMSTFDSLTAGETDRGVRDYAAMIARTTLGSRDARIVDAERALMISGSRAARPAIDHPIPTLAFGLLLRRREWPDVGATPILQLRPAAAMARRDTLALRAAARALDSVSYMPAGLPSVVFDSTGRWGFATVATFDAGVIAADAYLLLGDSASALRRVRRVLDSALVDVDLLANLSVPSAGQAGWLWPRLMLQRADLARALGYRAEARLWYARFLDLWSRSDAEFAAMTEHARRSLRALRD